MAGFFRSNSNPIANSSIIVSFITLGLAAPTASIAEESNNDLPSLICAGTEPFWSLELNTEQARFNTMDYAQPVELVVLFSTVATGRVSYPRAMHLQDIGQGEDGGIAVVSDRQCSDGMSDNTYKYSLDFLTQKKGKAVLLTGCCRQSPVD